MSQFCSSGSLLVLDYYLESTVFRDNCFCSCTSKRGLFSSQGLFDVLIIIIWCVSLLPTLTNYIPLLASSDPQLKYFSHFQHLVYPSRICLHFGLSLNCLCAVTFLSSPTLQLTGLVQRPQSQYFYFSCHLLYTQAATNVVITV